MALSAWVEAAGVALAQQPPLELPAGAVQTGQLSEAFASYAMPIGPFRDGALPVVEAEGRVTQTAWRLPGGGAGGTLAILAALRDQLDAQGFALLFGCAARECGGFDFRFGTRLLPEPQMHVDLGDFRYLATQRIVGGVPEYVGVMVSRTASDGYVHITSIGPAGEPPDPDSGDTSAARAPLSAASQDVTRADGAAPDAAPPPAFDATVAPLTFDPATLTARLDAGLGVVLEDLIFASGSAELMAGDFASLGALAAYLRADPERAVVVVGHTDSSGGLDGNITLSQARAESVARRVRAAADVTPGQVGARGVGPLAPRAANQTEAGRAANRRVEVVPVTPR